MTDAVPAWLENILPGKQAGYARLAIAQIADEKSMGRAGFALSSPAFEDGDELDPSFTASEEDSVAPPLEWTAPPLGSQEMVLIVEDASTSDVMDQQPHCHWLVWGIAPQRGKLLEGEAPPRAGKNASGNSEWLLPDPAIGSGSHTYVFQLFAVDLPLTLMPGATRDDLLSAIKGRITGSAVLTATFTGREQDDEEWSEGL